jgi:hypothetical protein
MRRAAAAISPLAVALAAGILFGGAGLGACATDASDTGGVTDDGAVPRPDVTYYDTNLPPNDGYSPPYDDGYSPPPPDTGPPPPSCAAPIGQPCFVGQGDCPIFFQCLAAAVPTVPTDAGVDAAPDAADGGDAGVDAAEAGPQPDGVCVGAFDLFPCTSAKCAGSRCLLAADICLAATELPCVCGSPDAGASPCGL